MQSRMCRRERTSSRRFRSDQKDPMFGRLAGKHKAEVDGDSATVYLKLPSQREGVDCGLVLQAKQSPRADIRYLEGDVQVLCDTDTEVAKAEALVHAFPEKRLFVADRPGEGKTLVAKMTFDSVGEPAAPNVDAIVDEARSLAVSCRNVKDDNRHRDSDASVALEALTLVMPVLNDPDAPSEVRQVHKEAVATLRNNDRLSPIHDTVAEAKSRFETGAAGHHLGQVREMVAAKGKDGQ